jgi:hypothetical protein
VGLVPDGVATVSFRLADGTDRAARVRGNAIAISLPAPAGHTAVIAGTIWRDAAGRVLGP